MAIMKIIISLTRGPVVDMNESRPLWWHCTRWTNRPASTVCSSMYRDNNSIAFEWQYFVRPMGTNLFAFDRNNDSSEYWAFQRLVASSSFTRASTIVMLELTFYCVQSSQIGQFIVPLLSSECEQNQKLRETRKSLCYSIHLQPLPFGWPNRILAIGPTQPCYAFRCAHRVSIVYRHRSDATTRRHRHSIHLHLQCTHVRIAGKLKIEHLLKSNWRLMWWTCLSRFTHNDRIASNMTRAFATIIGITVECGCTRCYHQHKNRHGNHLKLHELLRVNG